MALMVTVHGMDLEDVVEEMEEVMVEEVAMVEEVTMALMEMEEVMAKDLSDQMVLMVLVEAMEMEEEGKVDQEVQVDLEDQLVV